MSALNTKTTRNIKIENIKMFKDFHHYFSRFKKTFEKVRKVSAFWKERRRNFRKVLEKNQCTLNQRLSCHGNFKWSSIKRRLTTVPSYPFNLYLFKIWRQRLFFILKSFNFLNCFWSKNEQVNFLKRKLEKFLRGISSHLIYFLCVGLYQSVKFEWQAHHWPLGINWPYERWALKSLARTRSNLFL